MTERRLAAGSPDDLAWLGRLVDRSPLLADPAPRAHWRTLLPWLPSAARYELAATLRGVELAAERLPRAVAGTRSPAAGGTRPRARAGTLSPAADGARSSAPAGQGPRPARGPSRVDG